MADPMADLHWCDADDPLMPHGCPLEPERYVRAACVHEHVREGWLCWWHLERMTAALCRVCHELGHDCPLSEAVTARG